MNSNRQKKLSHNKLKNTGLIFELLVRQLATDALNKKNVSKARDIIETYFNNKTEINKEYQIYSAILAQKNKNRVLIREILKEALDSSRKIDVKQLKKEKYQLIKTIKETYKDTFFKTSVPDYRLLASIYKLLILKEESNIVTEIGEVALIRENLFSGLQNQKPLVLPTRSTNTEYVDKGLAFKIMIERFNEKYNDLGDSQKNILKLYVENASNSEKLKEALLNQMNIIDTSLKKNVDSIEDEALKIKVNMAIKKINDIRKRITEGIISQPLISAALVYNELESKVVALKEIK